MVGSSRLTEGVTPAYRAIEAMRTLINAQFTIAGSGSVAATLKKPPKKKIVAPTATTIASAPIAAKRRMSNLPAEIVAWLISAKKEGSAANGQKFARPAAMPEAFQH